MSSLSLYTLTDAGRRIQALVEAGTAMFKFTRMKLGDGEATSISDYAALTDLINPVYTGLFSTATARDNTVRMSMTVSNASISSALTVRELGIFVEDPEDAGGNDVLFAVSIDSNPETIPAGSSSSYTVRTYKASIHISDTSNITAVVDPAGLVTAEDVEDMYATQLIAMSPAHYERNEPWTGGASATRTSVESPAYMTVNINDKGYVLHEQQTFDIDTAAVWDDTSVTNYTVPANRAGKDFYIFACVPSSGTTPDVVISANSTVPTGYNADNSRKIGGFHCLCVDAGTNISDHGNIHPLSGYIAGDILPASVWDLKHRPVSSPEGMVFDEGSNIWVDIYLSSQIGTRGADSSADTVELVSSYGGVCADGASAEAYHCWKFEQQYAKQKKRLPYQREFFSFSLGSNQGTNVAGSSDVNTTGGFKDTAGRRMISNIGCEDCCGNLWQWGADVGSTNGGNWTNAYDGNDHYVAGQVYWQPYRVLLGGSAADGASCGSRGAAWNNVALDLGWDRGARGASEPLGA